MDIVKYANTFQASSVLKTDGISRLMDRLGNPQNKLQYIHVAATNGKGSVCAFLQSILTASGLKCGKFSSPYLEQPEENISIDGDCIPRAECHAILNEIGAFGDGLSPFELWTAAAFLYFSRQNCDIVVLECGLGGTGDATNIIPPPKCAVLTRIGLDHMEYLGNTIEEITYNKCGIIKEGTQHTVTPQQPAAPIIKRLAKGTFHIAPPVNDLPLSLHGKHQAENAGIAAAVCRALSIPEDAIRYGLSHAVHPGRFEIFRTSPTIIFDGAHNPNGAEALCENLPQGHLTLICAFMADKDIDGVFAAFTRLHVQNRAVMLCTQVPDNPRALSAEALTEKARQAGFDAKCCPSILDALRQIQCTTLVFGSLYLYAPFKSALNELYKQ